MRALAIVLLLAACSVPPMRNVAPASPTASQIAERDTVAFRTECARRVLSAFIEAFNAGDAATLATFFSATQGSQPFWWFVTPETAPYGPDINRLAETFARWHATGERWRLISVESPIGPSWHGGVDFTMKIERSWPDRTATNVGKGALDCTARTIFVFSLAG